MRHIDIKLTCTDSPTTAVGIALRIAKELKEIIYLDFPLHGKFTLGVSPESSTTDLMQIVQLKIDIAKLTPI